MTRARSLSKLSNPATFTVDTDNNIGVNSTSPKEKLNVVGVISATSFFGDGSGLTSLNVGAGGTWNSYDSNTGITTTKKVKIENDLEVTGVVTARSGLRVVGGGLTVTGVSTFFDGVNVVGGGLTVTGVTTFFDAVNLAAAVNVNNDMTFDGTGNNLRLNDNSVLEFGTGNDLNIFHNSSVSVISDSGAGGLQIDSDNEIKLAKNGTGNDSMAVFTVDGSAELYYDGAKKIETTAGGVSITGTSTCTGSVQVGSGQSFGANGPTAVYYGDGSNLTNLNIPAGFTELDAALFN